MRTWLQWLTMGVVAGLAAALFVYLFNCGPGMTGEAGTGRIAAGGAPAEAPGAPPAARMGSGKARTIRIGWTAWADAEVMSLLAQNLLENRLGMNVQRVMTDIGIQYQSVANGDLDIMLMAWLPVTHHQYWVKVRDKVVNLGVLYTGRLGWVVPDYVPKDRLDSIADLRNPEVAKRIGNRIQGIDPGSGLMQASEKAMRAYGLDNLQLVAASGAAMTAVLDRAIRHHQWVVVTAWRPHWIFAQYHLRFLKDPKGILGGEERIHAIARQGFQSDFPAQVTNFFSRLYLPEEDLAHMLLKAQKSSPEEAVRSYIRSHPERVRYWVTGKIAEPGKTGRAPAAAPGKGSGPRQAAGPGE